MQNIGTNSKCFTKLFLVLHALFFVSCQTMPNPEATIASMHQEKKQIKQEYFSEVNDNWKITRQKTTYDDNSSFSIVSSIMIQDKDFDLEFIAIDKLNPDDDYYAVYNEGDKISLQSTDFYYPTEDILQSKKEENHEFAQCESDEFKMFARIYSNFSYRGVIVNNDTNPKTPWFKFGNLICAKIIHH